MNGAFVADVNHSFFACLVSHPFGDGCSPWLEPQNTVMAAQLIEVIVCIGTLVIENPTASVSYQ